MSDDETTRARRRLHAIAENYTVEAEKNRKQRHWHNYSSFSIAIFASYICYPIFNYAMNADHIHLVFDVDASKEARRNFQHLILTLHILSFHYSISLFIHGLRYSHRSLAYNTNPQQFQTTDKINTTFVINE